MEANDTDYPQWLKDQRGYTYRGHERIPVGSGAWLNRNKLVRRYADYLTIVDRPVTIEAIRGMLQFVDRGYSLEADQISRALAPFYASGRAQRYANGFKVVIKGCPYRSIRAAAEAEGVSPQTVSNRIASNTDAWSDWRRID